MMVSDHNKYKKISEQDYLKIAGPDWPNYSEFVRLESIPNNVLLELESMVSDVYPEFVFSSDNNEYKNFLVTEYFTVIKNKSVLELGPNDGFHTKLLQELNPSFHEVIEPDSECAQHIRLQYPNVSVINDDAFQILSKDKKFDVVICFGLLYHLHSPLYLLELIVNRCDPKFILIDCVDSPEVLQFEEEPLNVPGSRHVINLWKTANFNLVAPFEIIAQSMKHMGYKIIKNSKLEITDNFSKHNSWIGIWQKEENPK